MEIKHINKKISAARKIRKKIQSVLEKSISLTGVDVHTQLPILNIVAWQKITTFPERKDRKEHARAHLPFCCIQVEGASKPLHPTKHRHGGPTFFGSM